MIKPQFTDRLMRQNKFHVLFCLVYLTTFFYLYTICPSSYGRGRVIRTLPIKYEKHLHKVFTGLKSNRSKVDEKEAFRLSLLVSSQEWELVQTDIEGQRLLLQQQGDDCYYPSLLSTNNVLNMFDDLANSPATEHLAHELWKYCALILELTSTKGTQTVAAYLDMDSPILSIFEDTFESLKSHAVLADDRYFHGQAMHGSLLVLQKTHVYVAKQMVHMIVRTGKDELLLQPMLIPNTLYSLISQMPSNEWNILKQRCYFRPLGGYSSVVEAGYKNKHHCPSYNEYCCDVINTNGLNETGDVVMMTRQFMLPYSLQPPLSRLSKPFAMENNRVGSAEKGIEESTLHNTLLEDLSYITTIREDLVNISKPEVIRNFFDTIWTKECNDLLPQCNKCLSHGGGTCEFCSTVCPCHCENICKTTVPEKPVTKVVRYKPPQYKRDSHRLIPRIVHQTWYEMIEVNQYPNFSRLTESWKQEGWEYRFYNDDDARNFLQTHFPIEVLEAFDILIPGAFKADLFRYCVLFIHGGIYADADVLLTANLESAIDNDVGFMTPFDSMSP